MDTSYDIVHPHLEQFVRTGKLPDESSEQALAEEVNRHVLAEVQRSLPAALSFARTLVRKTGRFDGPLRLAAYRALARAALMSGQYAEAERAYLGAREMARRDRLARGRIDRTLIDVYMYLGRFDESRRRARLALRTFRSLDLPDEIAKTKVNYANLLHRQDRHREAERLYGEAAAFFESVRDELSAARCYFNRGNTMVQLFRFVEAEELYEKSARIYEEYGRELDAVDAQWGISWLHMLEGKFHIALRELHDCERAYERIGVPLRVASCELDRAEVFLNLSLYHDARDAAAGAEQQFAQLGIRYERAKAAYYRARAAYMLGHHEEGRAALTRAAAGFAKDENAGFTGAVHLLKAQTARSGKTRREQLQTAFDAFRKAQLPLWQAVCDVQSIRDTSLASPAARRLERNRAAHQVPHLFAAWQTALGDMKVGTQPAVAVEHWKRAADRLDMVRAQLPPIELRSTYGKNLDSPHQRLVTAELDRDPIEAAVWSERLKTAGVWAPPLEAFAAGAARKRVSQSLMALAGQVAALSRQISGGGERGVAALQNSPLVTRLQRQVRQELLAVERDSSAKNNGNSERLHEQFRRAAQSMPIVQWHIGADDIVAFVHSSEGTRSVGYRHGRSRLERAIMQWRFLLESAALADILGDKLLVSDEHSFLEDLGEWLIKPLELSSSERKLLVLPEGELANLPWAAIRLNNRPLGEYHDFVVSPSLRHHIHARAVATQSQRVELFTGPSADLPAVSDELRRLETFVGDNLRRHDPCRRDDWPESGSARLWHFSGHAVLNRENPFYSSLSLHDGPLFAADLRLRRATVDLVALAACQSGTHVALPGEESTGLVRSFLEMGARNVVAGHWPVSDRSTAAWMNAFYERYFQGEPITRAAHFANSRVMSIYPSAYHWAAFSIFGAGS